MPDKLALMMSLLLASLAAAAGPESLQAQARLAELGRLIMTQAAGPSISEVPSGRAAIEQNLDALCREPRNPIRKAIDQALRGGNREERLGALALHNRLIASTGEAFPREPLNGTYPPLFYRLIQEDDRTLPVYTEALAEGFTYYPRSRLTALATMDIARRARSCRSATSTCALRPRSWRSSCLPQEASPYFMKSAFFRGSEPGSRRTSSTSSSTRTAAPSSPAA